MMLAAFAGGLCLIAVGARFWRIATWTALVLMIYEGALRKWALPQFHEYIYFLKDGILLGAYVGCFFGSRLMRNRPLIQRHAANILIFAYAAFCLVQILNPRMPNWLVGVYGFQSYLFYIPLMYMVPDLLPDEKTFRRFVIGVLIASAVPLALGMVQFNLPPDHVLNRYVWSDQNIATFGASLDRARVTSTFSYITGYTVYLTALGMMLLALVLFERRAVMRLALYGTLLLVAAEMLMTGSRAPVVEFVVAIPFVVLLTAGSASKRHVKAAVAALVLVPMLFLGAMKFFPDAHAAFMNRVATNDGENLARVSQLWRGTADAVHDAGYTGYGIGTTLPGSSFLYDATNMTDPPPWVEAELEHVIVETGVLGFVLTLAIRLLLPFQLWRAIRQWPRSSARPLMAAAVVFIVISIPMQIIVSRTAGLMFWFMAGFAFLPAQWAAASSEAPVPVPEQGLDQAMSASAGGLA